MSPSLKNVLIFEDHNDTRVAAISDTMRTLKQLGFKAIGLEFDDNLTRSRIQDFVLKELNLAHRLLSQTKIISDEQMRMTVRERLVNQLATYSKYLLLINKAIEVGLNVFAFDKTMPQRYIDKHKLLDKNELFSAERESTMASNIIKANQLFDGPVFCIAGLDHKTGLQSYLGTENTAFIDFDDLVTSSSTDGIANDIKINLIKMIEAPLSSTTFSK